MYCQTSSSVQLLIGNTRMCSPACTRALYRFHSSGRCSFGSHWPKLVAEREDALLGARLLLVAPRAADAARRSGIPRSLRAASPTGARCGFRRGARSRTRRCAIESSTVRTIRRSPSSATRRSRNSITSGKLWPVSTCSSGNGKRARAKRLLGEAQQHERILAAGEQQRRVRALAGDLAQDVDRFGLEPVEVVRRLERRSWQRASRQRDATRGVAARDAGRIPSRLAAPTTSGRRGSSPTADRARARRAADARDSRGRAAGCRERRACDR